MFGLRLKPGPLGTLGYLVLAFDAIRLVVVWLIEWPPLRALLEMANLGQAVDFILEHWQHPGWLGNPAIQLLVIAIGFGLIFWDKKRPSWLPSADVSSRQMIIGGLIIIVLGAVVVGIGLWRNSQPIDPQVAALQSQISDLKQKLLDAAKPVSTGPSQREVSDLEQKLAQAQQELARRQVPQPPVDPLAPPPPKIPYQDGPILKRMYVDDEPKTLINALRELTQLAIAMQRDIVITQELTMRRRAGSGNQNPQNWAQALIKSGYDNVSKQLSEIGNKAKDYNDKMNAIIAKPEYDYFTGDLYQIVGQTGLQELQSTAGGYVYSIQLLQKKNIPETIDNTDIIWPVLNESVRSFEQASVNFRYWNNSFLNQRAPAAREQLEKLLPKAAQ
jgi:hypothetical protein